MVNFFKRKKLAEPVVQTTRIIHAKSVGSYGSENYSGYAQEEYLHNLVGSQRALIFDKMRRSDPQIAMLLTAVKAPILAANWEIQPHDPNDEECKKDAELMKHILFEGMENTWAEFVEEALTCLDFGFSVFEAIDNVKLNHPELGSFIGVREFAFRSQKTIERWNLDKETGKLKSVSQYAYGDLDRFADIPAEFLLCFTLKKEGANYEGVSALRPCYGSWLRKNNYLKLNAIGIEKFAVPTPIAEVPEGKESGEQFSNLLSVLEKYQSHESAFITHPAGWKITLQSNVYDPQKVETSIDNEDKRMAKAFVANFLELGMNGFGSQSLSFDLSDFFLKSLQHIANKFTTGMNRVIIPRYINLNRPDRKVYPKMCVTGIDDSAGLELSQLLGNYVTNNIITPDDPLEDHVRKRHGFPEKSDVGKRESSIPQFSERMKWLKK